MMNRERGTPPLPHTHEETTEPGRFGCPMLAPIQWERAVESRVPTSRCLIGWSLTGDPAIARCRATHAVIDCWKAHPERMPIAAVDEPAPNIAALQLTAAD